MAAIQQQQSGISDITDLINLFRGQSTNVSGNQNTSGTSSSTVQNNVSPEGVNALVRQILEGSQGLANVASGQRGAGIYNSSTNRLLINDLTSRVAGEAAKLNASTTTTGNTNNNTTSNTNTTKEAPLNAGKTALGMLANSILSPLAKAAGKKFTDFGSSVVDAISGGGNAGLSGGGGLDGDTTGLGGVSLEQFAPSSQSAELLSSLANIDVGSAAETFSVDPGDYTSTLGVDDFAGSFASEGVSALESSIMSSAGEEAGGEIFSWLFADGGRVPNRKAGKYNELGSVAMSGSSSNEGAMGTANSTGPYGGGNMSGVLGGIAQAAIGVAMGNPIGFAMGVANAASNSVNGQSLLGSIASAFGFGNGEGNNAGGIGLGGAGGSMGQGGDFGGVSEGSYGGGDAGGDSFGGEGSEGGNDGDGDGGGSIGGAGDGFKSGGPVPGHDTEGKDDIPIRVSGGEHIIPVDVVDALGPQFFDQLISMFHTPIRR